MTASGWQIRRTPTDDERGPTGIAVAAGATVVVGVAATAVMILRTPDPRLGLLVVAVAAFSAMTGNGRAALAAAGVAWPVGNGFLVNRGGDLSWHGRLDAWFLLGRLWAAAVGTAATTIRRARRNRRRWRLFTVLLRESSGQVRLAPGAQSVRPDGRVEGAGIVEESGR
ncbi:hypothetical protein ACNTMW_31680 [Planosporangium sp. 12N6]|uniref:hypothetical protein n=1 Tax=Planosporangium spinosum TaxID=3402278 RepID=UPI003CF56A91